MDGNGRAGRALVGMIMLRRRVLATVVPPVSLVLADESDRYVKGLTSFRYRDEMDWPYLFTDVALRAASASEGLAAAVLELQGNWRARAGNPRSGSASSRIIAALPAHPVLTLSAACEVTGLSDEVCRKALNALEAADVLQETTAGRRNHVWESVGLFDLLDRLERETGGSARGPAATHKPL